MYAGEYHCAIKPCVCISRARERMKKRESRSIGEQTFSFLTARLLFFEMHFASFFFLRLSDERQLERKRKHCYDDDDSFYSLS